MILLLLVSTVVGSAVTSTLLVREIRSRRRRGVSLRIGAVRSFS